MKPKLLTISILLFLSTGFYIPFSQAQTFETTVVGTETISARPTIFSDPLGHLHVAWVSDDVYGEILRYSTNQSGEWLSRRVAGTTNDVNFVPVIVADKYGFAYISYRHDNGSGHTIRYITNKNQAIYNWSLTTKMTGGHFHESSIEVGSDQGVHIFAQEDELDPSASRIFYDNFVLTDTVFTDNIVQYYSTTIDQNDDLHVVGYRGDNIYYKKYSSSSWSSPVAIDGVGISAYQPSITCDINGKLHVVFNTSSGIYYLNNTSGSWSISALISGTSGAIFPDVVVDENGKAHIAYNTTGSNGTVYYTTNYSGSWLTPQAIATIETDGNPTTVDVTHVDSKIALDLKTSKVNIVYVQNGNQVTVASTDDYELRSSKSTDLTSTLTSTAGTPAIDTLTTFDASTTQTLLQFTITDVANDGEPTTIESIVFQRGPGMSDDVCFNDLFSGMTIEEVGQSSEAVTLYSSRAIIGAQGSTWNTISEGGSKSFILKGVLNSSLSGVLNKDFQIKVNGLNDVIVNTNGSLFSYSSSNIISDTLRIQAYSLDGSGFEGDPYLISSLNDLKAVSEGSSYWSSYLKQTADIDATATSSWNSGSGFSPIGNVTTQFTGSYDGNGHTISNLYIDRALESFIGLFGYTNGASIQKLGLPNANIDGSQWVGTIGGILISTTIDLCYASGSITGGNYTGGLVGYFNASTIRNSYARTNVTAKSTGFYWGGLAGAKIAQSSVVANCFSTGSVSGTGNTTCGFIGITDYIVPTNSFWDRETSGHSSSNGSGVGKVTSEMKNWDIFTDLSTVGLNTTWDFVGDPNDDAGTDDYWSIDGSNNDGYPWLTWEGYPPATNTWDGSESTDFLYKENWSLAFVPNLLNNVVVPSGGNQPLLYGNQSATINNLTVNSGASLTINSNASTSGSLIVKGTSSGNITYNRYMTGVDKWHLVSSPVGLQDINTLVVSNTANEIATNGTKYGLAPYDNSVPAWSHYTIGNISEAGNFVAGKGYELLRDDAGTVAFTGTMATSDVSISITTPISPGNPWNLVGNPFPSAINGNENADATNNFIDVNTAALNDSYEAIYVWDANAGTPAYITVNQAYSTFYVAPGQAFFVYSVSGGSTVNFNEAMQTHQTGDIFKSGKIPPPSIKLIAECTKGVTSTHIKYIEEMTTGLDPGYDAGRFSGSDNSFAVYTHLVGDNENQVDFDIQCLPADEYDHVIPVGLNAPENTEVVFRAEAINLPENIPVYFEDRISGTYTPLHKPGSLYSINIAAKNQGTGRFFIHTMNASTGLEPVIGNDDFSVIPRPQHNDIRIIGSADNSSQIKVYDMAGRMIINWKLNATIINDVEMGEFKSGIYIVFIRTSTQEIRKKIRWIKEE